MRIHFADGSYDQTTRLLKARPMHLFSQPFDKHDEMIDSFVRRHFASQMASHAVRQNKKTPSWNFCPDILIIFPHESNIGNPRGRHFIGHERYNHKNNVTREAE